MGASDSMRGTSVVKWADFWWASSGPGVAPRLANHQYVAACGTLEHVVGHTSFVLQRTGHQFAGCLKHRCAVLGFYVDEYIQSNHSYSFRFVKNVMFFSEEERGPPLSYCPFFVHLHALYNSLTHATMKKQLSLLVLLCALVCGLAFPVDRRQLEGPAQRGSQQTEPRIPLCAR